jgi:hypothetical protein
MAGASGIFLLAKFLAKNGVAGLMFFNPAANQFFGFPVGYCYRGLVGFKVGAQAGLKVAQGQLTGLPGSFDSKIKISTEGFGQG